MYRNLQSIMTFKKLMSILLREKLSTIIQLILQKGQVRIQIWSISGHVWNYLIKSVSFSEMKCYPYVVIEPDDFTEPIWEILRQHEIQKRGSEIQTNPDIIKFHRFSIRPDNKMT